MEDIKLQPKNDRSNLGVIVDPNIKVRMGQNAQKLLKNSNLSNELLEKKILSIGDIKDLWKSIRKSDLSNQKVSVCNQKVYLHEILRDGELLIPELEIPERNPELEKRIAALKNSLAEKEYQRMTQNVNFTSHHQPEESIGYQMKQMNSGLIAVFQFVISLACAFFFGFMGVELLIGSLQLAVRLLLGIACALIVGAAELYFLAVNLAVSEEGYSSSKTSDSTKNRHLKAS